LPFLILNLPPLIKTIKAIAAIILHNVLDNSKNPGEVKTTSEKYDRINAAALLIFRHRGNSLKIRMA
jgi:hypothetical protein